MAENTKHDGVGFTVTHNGLARELKTNVSVAGIINPPYPKDFRILNHVNVNAIWDTGATNTAISKAIIDRLGLKPTGVIKMHHAGGVALVNTFVISLLLPNDVVVTNVPVSEMVDSDGDGIVLIGMDIISLGDFIITNVDDKTRFTFRMPSIGVNEGNIGLEKISEKINPDTSNLNHNGSQSKPFLKQASPSRNQPCPCGSGKKYKHCHGVK